MLRRCSTCRPGRSRPARSGCERSHRVDGCLQAPRLTLQPRHRNSSRARKNTPSSISSVNFLVLVFCCHNRTFLRRSGRAERRLHSVSATIVDRRGVAPCHDGGDRDAVGNERGRAVAELLALDAADQAPRASRHPMIVAASGSVGETIAPRTKAISHGRPTMSACAAQATRTSSRASAPPVLREYVRAGSSGCETWCEVRVQDSPVPAGTSK